MRSLQQGSLKRPSRRAADELNDLFEMANLSPTLTGLPMVVWISERGRAGHDARVKVSLTHGRRARPDRTASVSVGPEVEIVAGRELERRDMELYANGSSSIARRSLHIGMVICSLTRSLRASSCFRLRQVRTQRWIGEETAVSGRSGAET
jgi:hypothetical protein